MPITKEKSDLQYWEKNKVKEPRHYKVLMHNDDFTTMDFVVMVLKVVFFKDNDEAEKIMMHIHKNGEAVVGIYSYDMAASKTNRAMKMAKLAGFPLRVTFLPE